MIIIEIIYTFLVIGALTFGGGYSMIALIQDQVVQQHQWISATEFADILALSQVTPGPVGINTATFTGYTAVLNAGHPQALAVAAALLASLAVLAIPLTLILLVGRWLIAHRDNSVLATVFPVLRLAVVGLIAAAAISLMPAAFAPSDDSTPQLSLLGAAVSIPALAIFAVVFALSLLKPHTPYLRSLTSPIALILLSALAGLLVYGL